MTAVPLSQIPSPYPFYIHPVPTGDGGKLPAPVVLKSYIILINPIDGFMKKRDLVIPNAVRNLIRSLIYSLPAFLFPHSSAFRSG